VRMPRVTEQRRTARRGTALIASIVLGVGALTLPSAQADPKITVKDVEAAFHEVEAINEQVNQLGVQAKETQSQIDGITADIDSGMAVYTAQKDELSGAVRALNNTRADALAEFGETSKELENRRAQLQDRQDALTQATKAADAKRADIRKKYEAAKAELARLTAAEQASFNQSNVDVPTDIDASGRAKAALAFAMAQIGDPYVYGGTGPNSWDCSGLVMKSWAAAGVSIPRVVGPQIAAGKAVPMSELQPGDIVAYGDMSHDGLYLGNGRVVHAPRPGKSVEVTGLGGFTRAARVG
jgi:cell wall-associated NlpC family hydrolase